MHPHQALQGLEIKPVATHRQISRLHQRQAEIAGQIGLLEPGLAPGAGGQQHQCERFVAFGQLLALLVQGLQKTPVDTGNGCCLQLVEPVRE